MAKGDFSAARGDLERALAAGYRAAAIDLATLLSRPSVGMLGVSQAISLLEQAWKNGVTIAGFELGKLYEQGVPRDSNDRNYLLAPDQARAWSWYEKSAKAGEPNALARVAEKEEHAVLTTSNSAARAEHLLAAFRYYASAAERARLEDWPDGSWRNWRYRRASIARLLAREGMTEQVADAYAAVRKQYAPQSTVWYRLKSSLGIGVD